MQELVKTSVPVLYCPSQVGGATETEKIDGLAERAKGNVFDNSRFSLGLTLSIRPLPFEPNRPSQTLLKNRRLARQDLGFSQKS